MSEIRTIARETARELQYRDARRRWKRNGAIAGVTVGAVLLAMLFLKLGQSVGTGRAGTAPTPPQHPRIRIDASGITIDGTPAGIGDAVSRALRAGGADVVVTGDARQGDVDQLLAALRASGVPFEVRG